MSASWVTLSFDSGTLLLTAPHDGRLGDPWRWDDRVGAWRTAAVYYAAQLHDLRERFGDALHDELLPPAALSFSEVDLPELRPEQSAALAAWREAGERGMVVLPTGTGKTVLALAAMAELKTTTLIVAPVRDLMYQWHRRIEAHLGYDAGIVGDGSDNLRDITVTTYDSAYIHMHRFGDRFGLVIFDEAHHLPGKARREAALLCAAPRRLGLTATPERADGADEVFPLLIGPEVYRLDVAKVKGKSLAHYDVVRIPVALTQQEQAVYDDAVRMIREFMAEKRKEDPEFDFRKIGAEANRDPAARAVQKAHFRKQAIEDRAAEKLRVLEDIFRLHVGERILVFAGSNAMALDVSRRFLVPTILSHTRKKERKAILDGFESGDFPVLVANQVLDEGVDVPSVKVAVIIGGHASTRQTKQRLGRILRLQGKMRATLYEVFCQATGEVKRSRARRRSDAFDEVKQFRIAEGQRIAYGRSKPR